MDFIKVDGANFRDDGYSELEFRLGVGAQSTSVGLVRGHGELQGVILHEAPKEQGGEGHEDEHDDDDRSAAGSFLHGREAPVRLMGILSTDSDLSLPRSKKICTRAGFSQAVPPVSCLGSSSTDHDLRSAS